MRSYYQQQGAALLLSLVLLLVLTLLAISGMQGSVLQEQMASAQRDGFIALEIAEQAMRDVEEALDELPDLDAFGSESGFYKSGEAPNVFAEETWDPDENASGVAPDVDGITPRFIAEYLGKVILDAEGQLPRDLGNYGGGESAEMDYARIVVMAQGPSGQSRRILEGFYVFKPEGLSAEE